MAEKGCLKDGLFHNLEVNGLFVVEKLEIDNLKQINSQVKVRTITKIDSLRTDGQTNIWDGLYKSLELFNTGDNTKYSTILLLTDGQPNISPARGEIETLKRLRKTKNFTSVFL